MKNKLNNFGFTILEMLLALSVLSVGIMTAFTLSLSNLQTTKDNYNRILAINLAREGLEIVRNLRDTNWLKMDKNLADCDEDASNGQAPCSWDFGFDDPFVIVRYGSPRFTKIADANTAEECFNDGLCKITENASGLYEHGEAIEKNMSRLVMLQAICFDADQDQATMYTDGPTEISTDLNCSDPSFEEKIGFRVSVQMYWESGGRAHSIDLVEDLYNWREYEN